MNIHNPYMAAAHRIGEPDENEARQKKHFSRGQACFTDQLRYRLHYGDTPVGVCVTAHPMEVHSWNKNARAYFAHQITLGRNSLPILEWREVAKNAESLVWRVTFNNNCKPGEILVSAMNKTAAKREAESMLPVTAVVKNAEQDDDVEAAINIARAANGEVSPESLGWQFMPSHDDANGNATPDYWQHEDGGQCFGEAPDSNTPTI